MAWFQLDPGSIAGRARAAGSPIPAARDSVMRGMTGFTIVSVAAFAPWAVFGKWFYGHLGEAGMYAVCALVFIGLSAPLLHRLIMGPGSLSRFYKLFSISFAAYSAAWITGWMTLRGHPGSIAGLLAGTAVMGGMLAAAFGAKRETLKIIAVLFVLNTIGYFAGGELEAAFIGEHNVGAKLLWGVTYGMGLGAGLGWAFFICQGKARALLREPKK